MNPHISDTPKKGAARCPRFDNCNAPVCPLDDWQRAQHLDGEPVCGLLCELVKGGGEARLRAYLPGALVDTLAEAYPKITARWARVRSQLERASRTGSKLESVQRLRQPKKDGSADGSTRPATVAPVRTSLPATTPLNGGSSAIGGTDGRR
jgi:hypothetical protein